MRRPKPCLSAPKCRTWASCVRGRPPRPDQSSSPGEAAGHPDSALIRRGEAASVFVAIEGGFRLVPVTLIAEDQDHVVISGAITDKDAVAISGLSALRGILQGLGTAE